MNLQKILNIGIAVIFVIAVALMIMINNGDESSSAIDMMLWFGKILVFGAGAIAIVLSFIKRGPI